jgi:hypothetical protein
VTLVIHLAACTQGATSCHCTGTSKKGCDVKWVLLLQRLLLGCMLLHQHCQRCCCAAGSTRLL